MAVCGAAREQIGFRHPLDDELTRDRGSGRDGTPARRENTTPGRRAGSRRGRWTRRRAAPARRPGWPCCTLAAAGVGEEFRTEGLLGGVFDCGIARETGVGELPAIVPRIGGRAWITGYARYVLQDDDPFPEGFVMGDIWPAANAGSTAERLAAARRASPGLSPASSPRGRAPTPPAAALDFADARATPELRVLRLRPAARQPDRPDLHLRVHVLCGLCREPSRRQVPQLRR